MNTIKISAAAATATTRITSNKIMPSSMIILAFLVCSSQIIAKNGEASKRYISEFTLDELTNTDSNYQPINFNHFGGPFKSGQPQNPAAISGRLSPYESLDGDRHVSASAALTAPMNAKRHVTEPLGMRKKCPPTKPFLCPSDDPQGGECIPIQYLCDGSSDCPNSGESQVGYDEDPRLCTAAKRPPVEETANFLKTLLDNHGSQYIAKLFGPRMKELLEPVGGPGQVAVALSVSKTIEDFGKALHLMRADIDHLRNVLVAVQTMDGPMLKNLGIVRNSELTDMKFFLEKLLSTGFLD